ncbi:uncharacterized protein V6R79_008719 [Siganus canaliculatus]
MAAAMGRPHGAQDRLPGQRIINCELSRIGRVSPLTERAETSTPGLLGHFDRRRPPAVAGPRSLRGRRVSPSTDKVRTPERRAESRFVTTTCCRSTSDEQSSSKAPERHLCFTAEQRTVRVVSGQRLLRVYVYCACNNSDYCDRSSLGALISILFVTVYLCLCNFAITVCELAAALQAPPSGARYHSDCFSASDADRPDHLRGAEIESCNLASSKTCTQPTRPESGLGATWLTGASSLSSTPP